jgi:hypothetical protein
VGEANEDVEVTVGGEQKPVDVTLEKRQSAIVPPEEGIESLKDQIARSRAEHAQRMGEKDRLIQEAAQRAVAAEREVTTTRKSSIEMTIESLQKDKDGAKRDWIAAQEAGDYPKAADAQDRMSQANARIVAAEQGRQALDDDLRAPPRQQPISTDRVEEVARTLQPRSADWVRQHPEFINRPDLNQKMIRAHHAAVGEGLEPDSDAYFTMVNRRLGLEREPETANEDAAPRRGDGSRAPTSAPVGRDVAQNPRRAASPGTVRLSAEEASAALALNLDPKKSDREVFEEYARNKVALMSEGKISR